MTRNRTTTGTRHRSPREEPPRGHGWRRAAWVTAWGVLLLAVLTIVVWQSRRHGNSRVAAPNTAETPRLTVDRERIDLGDVHLRQLTQASFEIHNAGNQPLRFIQPPWVEVAEGC